MSDGLRRCQGPIGRFRIQGLFSVWCQPSEGFKQGGPIFKGSLGGYVKGKILRARAGPEKRGPGEPPR